ncbi:MAG: hypothetical protein AB1861_16445 [Cyanobacteriota bacterium]
MTPKYFIFWYRLDQVDSYLIWYENEPDGVILDSTGIVPIFPEIDRLLAYVGSLGLHLEKQELILLDLDVVKHWLDKQRNTHIDCDRFLCAYNLFSDVALSVDDNGFDRDRQRTNSIYNKLFWGNNLPVVTPLGKHYEPIWRDDEIEMLRELLEYGLKMFRRVTQYGGKAGS